MAVTESLNVLETSPPRFSPEEVACTGADTSTNVHRAVESAIARERYLICPPSRALLVGHVRYYVGDLGVAARRFLGGERLYDSRCGSTSEPCSSVRCSASPNRPAKAAASTIRRSPAVSRRPATPLVSGSHASGSA